MVAFAILGCGTIARTHAQLGIEALEAGKHVVVEKPMDVTVEAAQRLADAAARCGRTLSVISQHRFDRATSRAAALGREPAVTAADGLRAVELVTAVYRSAATGQGVRLG